MNEEIADKILAAYPERCEEAKLLDDEVWEELGRVIEKSKKKQEKIINFLTGEVLKKVDRWTTDPRKVRKEVERILELKSTVKNMQDNAKILHDVELVFRCAEEHILNVVKRFTREIEEIKGETVRETLNKLCEEKHEEKR